MIELLLKEWDSVQAMEISGLAKGARELEIAEQLKAKGYDGPLSGIPIDRAIASRRKGLEYAQNRLENL